MNVVTLAGLLAVHFGDGCGYYKKTMAMKEIMELGVVSVLHENFVPELCHEITWAWIEDGRFYFSQEGMPDMLTTNQVTLPMSNIECIFKNVRYQTKIHRSTFPAFTIFCVL